MNKSNIQGAIKFLWPSTTQNTKAVTAKLVEMTRRIATMLELVNEWVKAGSD
jgi:nanoRNase/pAp phosphatase (c-di-AMP/oligoRNAs hydrolase)